MRQSLRVSYHRCVLVIGDADIIRVRDDRRNGSECARDNPSSDANTASQLCEQAIPVFPSFFPREVDDDVIARDV